MRNEIYEYIYLTRQERNGLIGIILFSILITCLPSTYLFFEKNEVTDFSFFEKEIEIFNQAEALAVPFAFKNTTQPKAITQQEIQLFPFDPNTTSKENFIQLGLTPKTAQTIINFRNKGAKFFKKEDFKKVYGINDSDYSRLENFIQIKKTKTNTSPSNPSPIAKNDIPKSYDTPTIKHIAFDPNTADVNTLLQNGIPQHVANTIIKYRNSGATFNSKEDLKKIYTLKENIYNKIEPYIEITSTPKSVIVKASAIREDFPKTKKPAEIYENIIIDINKSSPEDWQKLKGIGPSFSKRIVSFRDKLGGFYSINQVGETYGLPDSTFQNIKSQLRESIVINRINLNQVNEDELKSHPYFSWQQAKVIMSYRNMHGEFKSINDLLKIGALKKDWFEKVKYYIEI